MKKTLLITILTIIAMAQFVILPQCLAETVDRTTSTTATATKPEDINTSGSTLDNFNDNGERNLWDGATGVFPGSGGTCVMSNTISNPVEGSFCLKMDYNVDAAGSYSGYFSLLGPGTTPSKNLSNYKQLYVWVRGDVGGEFFKIEMKNNSVDPNSNNAFVYINDFLPNMGVSTDWRMATIPLHNFSNINNWTNAREFVVTFEEGASSTNTSQTHGTIYVDNIFFGTASAPRVYVERFSDKVNRSMLGGVLGPMGFASSSYSSTSGTYSSAPYSFLLQYNLPLYEWGGAYFIFGGGSAGNTPVPHNFSAYNYLNFWVKAMGPTQNPQNVKIELIDNGGVRTYWVTTISDTAQTIKIPLSSFTGLDKTTIKQLNFIFSYNEALYKSGGIYLDDIHFSTT